MVEQMCEPEGGYAGIAAALGRAEPGDVVRLAPGVYEGAETLWLGAGVTLSGEGALLNHAGTGPAVAAQDVAGAVVADIVIKVVVETVPLRRTPHAAPYAEGEEGRAEWGIVWFDGVRGGRVAGISIDGAKAAAGVYLAGGTGTDIVDCTVAHGELSGLFLSQSYARAIRGNRCHGNALSGIALESSRAEEIAGNECWQNQGAGIVLMRDFNSPDAPSEAALRDNRCHGNALSGIALESSRAEEIAGNECWQNQNSGIALVRGPDSPDAPSEAALRDNRCHGNVLSGIALESSRAEEIAGNECWQNQDSGIVLVRGLNSPDAPSEAALRDNRCHGNALFGIGLGSSHAEEIAGNECWQNQVGGIALVRGPNSPDAPSEAALRDNRCHGNMIVGIEIRSSNVKEIKGNRFWGNFQRGLRIAKTSGESEIDALHGNHFQNERTAIAVLHGTELPSEMSGNVAWGNGETAVWLVATPDGYRTSTPIPISFLPKPDTTSATAEALEEAGLPDAETLARFLDGPGCLHCLTDWWPAEPTPQDPSQAEHQDGRYVCKAEPDRLRFRREASGDGAAAIWAELDRLAAHLGQDEAKRQAETGRLALVTADALVIDRLSDQIDALRRTQAIKDDPPAALPDPVRRAIGNLRFAPIGVAEPVVIDHLPRSQAAMMDDADLPPMFDEALLRGRRRWMAALWVLWTSPAAWSFVLGLPFLIFAAAYGVGVRADPVLWTDPLAAAKRAISDQAGDLKLLDVIGLPGAAFALLMADLCFFLALLPPALRPTLSGRIRRRLETTTETDTAAWRRWARQRIFEREIGVVVIRDAQEWGPRDMADLRALMELRPADRALLVVLHTPGRSQMDRAVLRPLAERADSDEPDLAALNGLRLAVGRPPAPLDLNDPTDPVALGPLLGVPADDAPRLASRTRNIRNGTWSPSDIVPMLVMGSTPDLPMSLRRPVSELSSEFVPALETALLPLVRLFQGDPTTKLDLDGDRDLLRKITEEEAVASRAVHVGHRRGETKHSLDLVGQPGRRAALLSALRAVFDDDEERRAYLLRLLACGLLHSIGEATNAARRATSDRDFATLLRALRAAGQLDEEIETMGGLDSVRQAILAKATVPLAEAVAALRVPNRRDAKRLAGIIACRADRMGLLSVGSVLDGGAEPDTPAGVLADRVAAAAALHGKLDRGLAGATISRYLNFELKEADADLRAQIEARLANGALAATTLSDLIWAADDLSALLKVLEKHAPFGGQRAAILALQLAGASETDVKLAAARACGVLRDAGAPLTLPPPGSQRRVPHSDEDILRLAQFVQDPRTVALLRSDDNRTQDADLFRDVELGYFDPAHVAVERQVEVVLED